METICTIGQWVKPGVFVSKLDIKDAYYNIPISEPDQNYLEVQFNGFLYKCTALSHGFTKLLKPLLSELRRVEKIVIAGYFDDLIRINSSYASCFRNVSKIIKLFIALEFVIHSSKSQFIPTEKIEYLRFVIDSISMSVSLSNKKKRLSWIFVERLPKTHTGNDIFFEIA